VAIAQRSINSVPVGGRWLPESERILVKEIAGARERGERRPWTEADRNFLVQSIRHVPLRAIARELGRTENAVWCKIWERV
jgi:hypothetical protein